MVQVPSNGLNKGDFRFHETLLLVTPGVVASQKLELLSVPNRISGGSPWLRERLTVSQNAMASFRPDRHPMFLPLFGHSHRGGNPRAKRTTKKGNDVDSSPKSYLLEYFIKMNFLKIRVFEFMCCLKNVRSNWSLRWYHFTPSNELIYT